MGCTQLAQHGGDVSVCEDECAIAQDDAVASERALQQLREADDPIFVHLQMPADFQPAGEAGGYSDVELFAGGCVGGEALGATPEDTDSCCSQLLEEAELALVIAQAVEDKREDSRLDGLQIRATCQQFLHKLPLGHYVPPDADELIPGGKQRASESRTGL